MNEACIEWRGPRLKTRGGYGLARVNGKSRRVQWLEAHPEKREALKLYYRLPQWARLVVIRGLMRNPFRAKRLAGTAIVTTVNAVGRSAGWILPTRNMHSLSIAFGSITKKPWVVKGEVTIREILHLTITFDHDVIDGMPAQRFTQDLVSHIEKGILGSGGEARAGEGTKQWKENP